MMHGRKNIKKNYLFLLSEHMQQFEHYAYIYYNMFRPFVLATIT